MIKAVVSGYTKSGTSLFRKRFQTRENGIDIERLQMVVVDGNYSWPQDNPHWPVIR